MLEIRFMTPRLHVSVQTVTKSEHEWTSGTNYEIFSSETPDAYHVVVLRAGFKAEHSFPKRNVTHFEAHGTI